MKGTKGGWPKASAEKGMLLAEQVSSYKTDKRIMFGAPVYFVNGNMFAGIFGDWIFIRLSAEDRKEISERHGAEPFEPIKGRKMSEYIILPDNMINDSSNFDR